MQYFIIFYCFFNAFICTNTLILIFINFEGHDFSFIYVIDINRYNISAIVSVIGLFKKESVS
ncbi:hypothetical protein EC50588_A0081 [Escherichia coli 5.0588]|nr:hypothetical protein EC50588_A0081 [Escherichia coli 5.0588]